MIFWTGNVEWEAVLLSRVHRWKEFLVRGHRLQQRCLYSGSLIWITSLIVAVKCCSRCTATLARHMSDRFLYLAWLLGFGATTTGDTQRQSNRSITSFCSRLFLAVLQAAYGCERAWLCDVVTLRVGYLRPYEA